MYSQKLRSRKKSERYSGITSDSALNRDAIVLHISTWVV